MTAKQPSFLTKLLASQPVYTILGTVGAMIGGLAVSNIPEEYKAIIGAVLFGIAGKFTHDSVAAPVTLAATAAKASANTAKVLDTAPPNELAKTSEPVVRRATREAVESVGGIASRAAGQVVENVATNVIEGVSGRLGRLNPFGGKS